MSIAALVAFALTLGARTTFCEGISCAPGWEAFSSSCYKKMVDPNGWLGARFHCVLEGGDLVSFSSSAEEDFVKGKMGARSFWIGLSNLECNHKLCPQVSGKELKWTDNTLLDHSNWAPVEAASTKLESCAYVLQDAHKKYHPGKWRKVSCESSLAYMCKRSPGGCQEGQPCTKTAGLALTPVQTSACDPGNFLRGHFCYRFENTEKTWQAAEDDCVLWGGHLASVHSWEDGIWLIAHMQKDLYVGLKKNIKMYEWRDKTAMDPALWYPGHPRSGECGLVSGTGGQVYTLECDHRTGFACQKARRIRPQQLPGWSDKCGWEWLDNPATDFCYLMRGSVRKTWKEARDDCKLHGADLLAITDSHEQAFVHGHSKALLTSPSLWLDAKASLAEDGSSWADGSPFSYVHSSAGHHDSKSNGDCLSFLTDNGYWKFDMCENKRGYICKRRAATAQPAPLPHAGFVKLEVCKNADGRATCPEGKAIRIQSAFYGRRSGDVCPTQMGSDGKCLLEGALLHYKKECDNYRQCLIKPMKEDRCPNISKYLQMIYTCEADECFQSLGNTQGSLTNLKLKASSFARGFTADKARLNGESCWKPSANSVISWIEVNFGETKQVTALAIQPCPSASHGYRSNLEMRHSVDGRAYTKHPQQFAPDGTQMLTVPVMAQYLRIYPLDHRWSVGIRFDVLGCELGNMISCDQWLADIGFNGHPKTVLCPPGCAKLEHQVYGTLVYKADSNICAAAVHAGVIRDKTGGECTLLRAPPQNVFTDSIQNEIFSEQSDQMGAFAFTFADGETRCPGPDWDQFAGSCYKCFDDKKTWADAQHACGSVGTQLVSIGSQVEQEWLRTTLYFDAGDTWTGLNDLAVPGMFVWSDHKPVTLTFWGAGEPDNRLNEDEKCVAVAYETGRWKRMSCAQLNRFVCKIPKAHYPLASQAEPQVEAKQQVERTDSKLLFFMSAGSCKDLQVEMMEGLQVGSTIAISGQGNEKTKGFQANLLYGDGKIALQVELDVLTKTISLTSKLASDQGVKQQNQLLEAPLQPGVNFEIVIQCDERGFHVLAADHRLYYAYHHEHDLPRVTLLKLHGDVSLKSINLAGEALTSSRVQDQAV
ncbi:macrophage mannose receptor 1-like isoform 2-T3 [Syngnathus typhle]